MAEALITAWRALAALIATASRTHVSHKRLLAFWGLAGDAANLSSLLRRCVRPPALLLAAFGCRQSSVQPASFFFRWVPVFRASVA